MPARIRPGWLMPDELEEERRHARTALKGMMRRHRRYLLRKRLRAFLARPWRGWPSEASVIRPGPTPGSGNPSPGPDHERAEDDRRRLPGA